MSDGLQHGESSTVLIEHEDGETDEVEVFDHVTVQREHYINSVNGYETFTGPIRKGDMSHGEKPPAVTERVAKLLWDEFGISVEDDDDIRVVDMSNENVHEA